MQVKALQRSVIKVKESRNRPSVAQSVPGVDSKAMEGSEGNMSLKNPVTTPGIDPGTVRLVAQRLNHYANPGPRGALYYLKIITSELIISEQVRHPDSCNKVMRI